MPLTDALRDFPAPLAVVLARGQRLADHLVAALALVLGQGADLVRGGGGGGRVLGRADQGAPVLPVVVGHRQDAVVGQHGLRAADF